MMKKLTMALAVFGAVTAAALMTRPPEARALTPEALCFEGRWEEHASYGHQRFTFHLRLEPSAGADVDGVFTWRQEDVTGSEADNGRTGREYLAGRRAGTGFEVAGVRVSDPTLLGLDAYRIGQKGDAITGASRTDERDWSGRLTGRRVACLE